MLGTSIDMPPCAQHDELSKSKDFRGLVQACSNIVGCG